MKLYFQIIKFSFLRFFTYPVEIIANILKKFIMTSFIVLLWVTVNQNGENPNLDIRTLISYYLIATGVTEIVMSRYGDFGNRLSKLFKLGEISNVLIKPVNIQLYVYAMSVGSTGVKILISIAVVIVGILLTPNLTVFSFVSFFIFLILGIINAYAFNILEGIATIYLTEAGGFQGMLSHIKTLLGGTLVPIYLFPEPLRSLIELSPFPSLVYLPSYSIRIQSFDSQFIKYLFISVFWAITLNVVFNLLWRRSLKRYEAVGI